MGTVPGLAARARGLASHELVLATTSMAAINMGVIGVAAISPFIRDGFHLTTVEVGLIGALIYGIGALTTFPGGAMTDALGAGPTLATAQWIATLGLLGGALAPTASIFYMAMIVVGIGFGMHAPATNVLARSGIPVRRRGLAMSVKQTGVTVGGAIGAFTMALLAAAAGWRAAVLVPAAICFTVGTWGACIKRRGDDESAERPAEDSRQSRPSPGRPSRSTAS